MWIEMIRHDLRFALRQMKRSPGFTAVALAAIAVGIGANAAVFSFFEAIHLRTAPVADAGQLVALHRVEIDGAGARDTLSSAQYEYLRQHATAFTSAAAQHWSWTWLSHGDRSVELLGDRVSANYFGLLGVVPHIGRFLDTTDPASVVLSYRTWITTFDGDPAVVGRTVRLNQRPFTIVGVAPADFGGIYLGES